MLLPKQSLPVARVRSSDRPFRLLTAQQTYDMQFRDVRLTCDLSAPVGQACRYERREASEGRTRER